MKQTMHYLHKTVRLIDNYVIARLQKRPSTALFWYLPEPARIKTLDDLLEYKNSSSVAPFYLIDYRNKLKYPLQNSDGIIILPYEAPIGHQVNPEAAFQYALGLHDMFYHTQHIAYKDKFFHYANYFLLNQTNNGLWHYEFDWFATKAPWSSALAQARGASVMLRAWLHSKNERYLNSAKNAVKSFSLATDAGGFLHPFTHEDCHYYEEYPAMPTGVINGFMASLISLWELHYWLNEKWLTTLWQNGLAALEKMLPYYSTGWWSLYDRDINTPIQNVNSPRYHQMEMGYLQVLSVLSGSEKIFSEFKNRYYQYKRVSSRGRALSHKFIRKILYK